MTDAGTDLPLAGVRVVELSHIIAGPSAGFLLSELGADTIRVEPPTGGDLMREDSSPNARGWFAYSNRNKRSLSVDLKSEEGRNVFLRLAATADVVLDNFAPGVLDRLGLSFDELVAVNPRIVCLSIKGFGPGPNESRPMLDELAQMAGGLAFMTGADGAPRRVGASVVDMGAAAYGVVAVLAALLQRDRADMPRARHVTSGLFETVAFWVAQDLARHAVSGEPSVSYVDRPQGTRMGFPVYQLFETADGHRVFVGITSEAHWPRFCDALALTDLAADPRLATHADRVAAHDWLIPTLEKELGARTAAELDDALGDAGFPYARYRRPDEVIDDPHLRTSGQLVSTLIPGVGEAGLPTLPIAATGFTGSSPRSAPGRGEHTRELLGELGYPDDEIDALVDRGVVLLGASLDDEWRA
jgi:crotonobetainyl-CoA:carnitine CoA-transferase CaiB-like acyl-CoA transferase